MDEYLKSPEGLKAAADHLDVESDWLARQMRQMERAGEIAEAQMASDRAKGRMLPDMAYVVWSQDVAAAEHVEAAVRAGDMTWETARTAFGSYARMEGLLKLQEEGFATRERLLDIWAEEWPGADPDDTDGRMLTVWREANDFWRAKAVAEDGTDIAVGDVRLGATTGIIIDPGHPLREGDPIRVYRGQPTGAPLGVSWTLDRSVAERFANGAGLRARIKDGEVVELAVRRKHILAYLTSRGEEEVVIDPTDYHVKRGPGEAMPGFGLRVVNSMVQTWREDGHHARERE